MGEDTAVPEPGDGGDPVPLEGEHHQAVRTTDPGLGVGEIAAEGRLAIGPRGGEPERSTAQGGTIVEEARDRRVALILEGLGRHGEPGVVGEERDDLVRVAALDCVGEATDQLALARGARHWRALAVAYPKPALERPSRALERTLDRGLARLEHVRDLRRSKSEHVAQHQNCSLPRW